MVGIWKAQGTLGDKERKREKLDNEGDRVEKRRKNRLSIIFVILALEKSGILPRYDKKSRRVIREEDKTGFFKLGLITFSELLKATHLSRGVLAAHLKFLEKKGYLFSKNGVYRLNPEFKGDFKRISDKTVAWLGSQILLKDDREFKRKDPREFNRFLRPGLLDEGYERYSDEIKRFAVEEKRLRGIEL